MGDHRIIFEIHKAIFKSKIEIFRRYAEELESKFQSDLRKIDSKFDFDIEDEEKEKDYISYLEPLIDEKRMVKQDFINQYLSSTIISIYSLLERGLLVLADLLGRLKNNNLAISDLSGDGIVRNRNYYKKACDVELSKLNKEWSTIKYLNSLRNCVVHCEGDVSMARTSQNLSTIIENTKGLRLERDHTIIFELPYLAKIIDVAENFFSGVVDAPFEIFRASNKSSQKDVLKRTST